MNANCNGAGSGKLEKKNGFWGDAGGILGVGDLEKCGEGSRML